VLFPIPQGTDGKSEGFREFGLGHAEPLPQRLHREIRRIFANASGSSGWASGSERAAASTSSSVIAFTRAQSVSPRGGASPGFTVSRVVPVLLIARAMESMKSMPCLRRFSAALAASHS